MDLATPSSSRALCSLLVVGWLLAAPVPAFAGPGDAAAERVLGVLAGIGQTLREGRYSHVTRIDVRRGRYEFDCSAMAGWVLAKAAPVARRAVKLGRPAARDFYDAIVRATTARPRAGWLRRARIADAQPGDVLAWRRPPFFQSRATGHVAFVLAPPVAVPGGWLVRIADSTSLPHDEDDRAAPRDRAAALDSRTDLREALRTGFGRGTLYVATDPETGQGTGYGWFGRLSQERGHIIETPVVVGRAVR